ncbi:putative signal peptide protein [Ralstonia pseudosolanacearum FQY_4]|nr:putative signal peptide protein [Ralstonia pseudosolanacearum FQY_4]
MGALVCAGAGAKDGVVPVPMVGAVELNDGDAWIAVPTGKTVNGPVGVVTLEGTYRCCYAVGPQQARHGNREFSRDREALSWHALTCADAAQGCQNRDGAWYRRAGASSGERIRHGVRHPVHVAPAGIPAHAMCVVRRCPPDARRRRPPPSALLLLPRLRHGARLRRARVGAA